MIITTALGCIPVIGASRPMMPHYLEDTVLDFKIYTFLNACETLNFSKTAETMHITQPAVSQQIHALEAEFNKRRQIGRASCRERV